MKIHVNALKKGVESETGHNTMGIRHLLSEGIQDNGLCVIFGMEYYTAQGDFLLFGPFETLQPHLPADLLLNIVEQSGGIAVAAHPFRKGRSLDQRVIDEGRCCAIESLNGRNTPSENLAVEQWHQYFDLTECGGSDAHSIEEVATFATRFFGPVRMRSDLIHVLKNATRSWQYKFLFFNVLVYSIPLIEYIDYLLLYFFAAGIRKRFSKTLLCNSKYYMFTINRHIGFT